MSWGVSYQYDGYLIRLTKNELPEKLEDLKDDNDAMWREILAYMASTPPANIKDSEGSEYPFNDFIANHIKYLRDEIERNTALIARIEDCMETMHDHPELVTEG